MKASKDSENAIVAVNKEVSGANNPKKLAQLQNKAAQAAEKAATADQEYKDVLKTTNTKQQDFYTTDMPHLLTEFQQFEEDRITFTRTTLSKYGTLLLELPPNYLQTSENVAQDAAKIDPVFDLNKFTQENKTGITTPPPMEYHQYEMNATMPSIPSQPSTNRINSLAQQPSKEWGLTASDEGLSAEQKRAKLEQQLNELDAQIRTETTSKNGVEKLIQFYANDQAAQKKAEAELADSERKLKDYQESKRKVKAQLVELNGGAPSSEAEPSSRDAGSASGTAGESTAEEKVVLVKVRGLFDYVATCDTELSFKEGDILTITEQDESGWWYAEVDGKAGFVPQNYVEVTE